MSARWRKQPSEKGLARVCQGPRGFELWEDGKLVARVSPQTGYGASRFSTLGWYWYGWGKNSLNEGSSFASADDAKADVMKFYREYKTPISTPIPEEMR